MDEPTLDGGRSRVLGGDVVGRRAALGKAGALSLGAAFAVFGAPDAAGAVGAVPPPSNYTTLLGLCTPGSVTVTYTPGITHTLQAIHSVATVTFSPCAVAQNKVVTAYNYSHDDIQSCSRVTDVSGPGVIVYANGQSSTWTVDSWTATRLFGQLVGVVSGIISNGPFNGARVWDVHNRTTRDPSACSKPGGLTGATGESTLIIAE